MLGFVGLCVLYACSSNESPGEPGSSGGVAGVAGGEAGAWSGSGGAHAGDTGLEAGEKGVAGAPGSLGGASAQAGAGAAGAGAPNNLSGGAGGDASTTSGGATTTSGGAPTESGGAPLGGDAGAPSSQVIDPCRGTPASGFVPAGFCAVQVGSVPGARQITFSSNGDLWVTSAQGGIFRLRDTNQNGSFEAAEIVEWANTGGNGQNSHIDEVGGYLYAGSKAGVHRWAWSSELNAGGAGESVVRGQPAGGGHAKHTTHVWDGYLYVMSASDENVSNENPDPAQYDVSRSHVRRFKLADFKPADAFDWLEDGEIFAVGLRNVLGFDRDAQGRIYGVVNGIDNLIYQGVDIHNNNPAEVIARLSAGSKHGFPFCFAAEQVAGVAPGTQLAHETYPNNPHDNAWCQANADKPVSFVPSHSAPMDIHFFTTPSNVLPARWKNGAFVSLHGSWNRSPRVGKKVVWVPFNANGTSPMPTVSGDITSFPYEVVYGESGDLVSAGLNAPREGFRPVGIAVSPVDGALYISSDSDNVIYRVGLKP